MNTNTITIEALVKAPLSKVWEYWNKPEHIEHWAFASDDWEAYGAENDLCVGGAFKTTMAAKDKSASFDFGGVYTAIQDQKHIEYDMSDLRHVAVNFNEMQDGVNVSVMFDPEKENSMERQRDGWQAILNNFKKYTEATS